MIKKWKVKRIGLLSAVKIGCCFSCIFGFVTGVFLGLIFAFFWSLVSLMFSEHIQGFGFGGLIIFPVVCTLFSGFAGSLLSLVFAVVYNLSAGVFGGVELEMETDGEDSLPEGYSAKLHEAI